MKQLECIITVKDKNLETKLIEQIHQFDTMTIIDVLKTKVELIEKMNVARPDILIVDLDTNEWDSTEIISQVQRPPFLIGITNKVYNTFSLLENGFFDILTPKLEAEIFYKKIAKILRIVRHYIVDNQSVGELPISYRSNMKTATKNKNYIFVKYKKANIRLQFEDILYVCNMGNYLRIEQINGRICYHTSTLKRFQCLLPEDKFIRINKSVIVNLQRIDLLEKDNIQLKNRTFKVSRIYAKALKDHLLPTK